MNEFSLALSGCLKEELVIALENTQSKLLLGLYVPSEGKRRFTALLHTIVERQGDDETIEAYLTRASERASKRKSGLTVIQACTDITWDSEPNLDFTSFLDKVNTNLPLTVLSIGESGNCSAHTLHLKTGERAYGTSVRVIGENLDIFYNDHLLPQPTLKEIYKRTFNVWGLVNHARLARLRVGIIGLGSVGSIVAESLARMGIERFVLCDFDEVQVHNLDRLLGAAAEDIGSLKVDIAERQVQKAATASTVEIVKTSFGVTEAEGYKHVLDCDVIFSCVDRPWPRHVLNVIAYNHLIPVIDGGIQVRLASDTLKFAGADWQAHTVGPGKICLECLNAFFSSDVETERQGLLEDPTYIAGLPPDHEFKRNENIFPFSANLASLEVLQLIELVTGIGRRNYYGIQRYSYNHGYIRVRDNYQCQDECYYQNGIALGDSIFPPPCGQDHAAEAARKRQGS